MRSNFSVLLSYVTPHWGVLLLVVALMLGESAVVLANPYIAGLFAEQLFVIGNGVDGLMFIVVVWSLLFVLQSLLSFANRYLLGSTGETMVAQLRSRLYDHLQALPLSYFHDRKRGDVLSLLGKDADYISNFVTGTLVGLVPLLVTLFGALYLLYRIDMQIALLAGVLIPAFYLATKIIGRRLRPLSSEWMRTHSEMFATLEENIGMLPAIKSFTREALESDRFQAQNQRLLRVAKLQLLIESILQPAIQLLAGLGILVLLFLGASKLQSGELQASELVSLLLYSALLTRPVSGMARVYGSIQKARGAADRLIEVFGVQPEPEDEGAFALSTIAGHIRFEGVHYGYPGRSAVLRGVDLSVAAGETLALTGENGSGKSTIVYLLKRFADPDQGRILIDGVDIRGATISSLRSQIGLVAQHVLLLNGTVKDNIAYGRPEATREEIEAAARAAQAHDFIARLPQEYDTVIGDHAIRLSGGQRQRLALARALLKDPPVLVLDEATAMFDPAGETAFIEDCRAVLGNRTVILITHRPASLALADRVLRMEDGRVADVDSGSRE